MYACLITADKILLFWFLPSGAEKLLILDVFVILAGVDLGILIFILENDCSQTYFEENIETNRPVAFFKV